MMKIIEPDYNLFRTKNILLTGILLLSFLSVSAQKPQGNSHHGAAINKKFTGQIHKNDLMQAGKISLTDDYAEHFDIKSFMLTRIDKDKNRSQCKNEINGELTIEMIELIKSSLSGDKLYFEYIKCSANDGTTLSLGSISFIIK